MVRTVRRLAWMGVAVAMVVWAASWNPGGLARYGASAAAVEAVGLIGWLAGAVGHVVVDSVVRRRVARFAGDLGADPSSWSLPDGWSVEIVSRQLRTPSGAVARWMAQVRDPAGRDVAVSWRVVPARWVGAPEETDWFPTPRAAGMRAARAVALRA